MASSGRSEQEDRDILYDCWPHQIRTRLVLWIDQTAFSKDKVDCLDDIARVVRDSAVVNHVQLVGKKSGSVLVHQYDWSSHFSTYFWRSTFQGIKSVHHITFSHTSPGQALVREFCDRYEISIHVLN